MEEKHMNREDIETETEMAAEIAAEPSRSARCEEEDSRQEIAALKEQIRVLEENHASQLQKLQIAHETTFALAKMGARNPALAARILDMDAITMDKDGLHGLTEQLEKLRISDPYLFHNTTEKGRNATGLSHGLPFPDGENMTDAEYYRFVRQF